MSPLSNTSGNASPQPTGESIFDTVVVGGGIMGASAAYALACRGHRVALLERFAPGHGWGSSHGDGRIIRFTYPEAVYVEMASLAFEAWEALQAESGEVLTSITGGWECGPRDCRALVDLEASFRRFDIPFETWDAAESARHFPHIRLPESSRALYQKDGGIVRADRAVAALWRLAEARGATLVPGVQVRRVEPGNASMTVEGAGGRRWHGGSVVLACGPWTASLTASMGLHLPLNVTRERVAYFGEGEGNGLDHGIGGMPTVIDFHTPDPFYALPKIDVPGVKLGWHHSGFGIDAEAARRLRDRPSAEAEDHDREVDRRQRRYVEERFPGLSSRPIRFTHCLYTNTPDYHFLIDRHPRWSQVVMACGFSGHGFKFGPVVGRIVADLVEEKAAPVDLDLFSLERLEGKVERRQGA